MLSPYSYSQSSSISGLFSVLIVSFFFLLLEVLGGRANGNVKNNLKE